jgi:hypothetical protein
MNRNIFLLFKRFKSTGILVGNSIHKKDKHFIRHKKYTKMYAWRVRGTHPIYGNQMGGSDNSSAQLLNNTRLIE